MNPAAVELLDEARCQALEATLVERIYEFNAEATGYRDGKLLGGHVRAGSGELLGGYSGHTWGGVCIVTHLWVAERYRGQGMGRALLKSAEAEALRRGCAHLTVTTHSFQAPTFYERAGYQRMCTIEDWPLAHSDVVYRKWLRDEHVA